MVRVSMTELNVFFSDRSRVRRVIPEDLAEEFLKELSSAPPYFDFVSIPGLTVRRSFVTYAYCEEVQDAGESGLSGAA